MADWSRQPNGGLSLLGKTVECCPVLVVGQQSLAAFLAGRGRLVEAEVVLKEAIDLDPGSADLYDFAAALYADLDNKERALEMCKNAVKYGTTNEYTIGVLYKIVINDALEKRQ